MAGPLQETAPVHETAPEMERLTDEVRRLESRVRALEDLVSRPLAGAGLAPAAASTWQPAAEPASSLSAGMIQELGRAILGIGGAYLLRAAAESGVVPGWAGAAAALVYAGLWLSAAARTRRSRETAGIVYAATSALILSPMLWETTVRFRIMPPAVTALLLMAFAGAGCAVAWLRDQPGVMWATELPTAVIATALMVGTGDLIPFAIALLAVCAMVETAASRNRWLGVRPWVALLADIGIWLLLRIAALPEAEAYRPVPVAAALALGAALLGIYMASVGARTVQRRERITLFEIVQLTMVYVLVLGGAIRLTHATGLCGVLCLALAAGSYFVAFHRFRPSDAPRDHHVYAAQGLAFLLTGSALLVSGAAAAMLWSGFALAALVIARRKNSLTLAIHGAICLAAGVLLSGLLGFGRQAFTGAALPEPDGATSVVAIAAAAGYLACAAGPLGKWARLAIAALAVYAAGALLIVVVARIYNGTPAAAWLAALRTLVGSSLALLLGFAGSRRKRAELIWIGYAVAALVTLKLFCEDFPHGSPGALAVSLLSYGAILVIGPRLVRPGTQGS